MKTNVRNHQGVTNTGNNTQQIAGNRGFRALVALVLGFVFLFGLGEGAQPATQAQSGGTTVYVPFVVNPGAAAPPTPPPPATTSPVMHAPFFDVANVAEDRFGRMGVFWFGKVTLNDNASDVRIGYNRSALYVIINTIDHYLWYDESSPSAAEASSWDAASLYLTVPSGGQSARQMRFDAQLSNWQPRSSYQAAFERDGSGWARVNTAFTSATSWRGSGLNQGPAGEGWMVAYTIPFSSLGLSGMPAEGSAWKMGLAVYDQDTGANGPTLTTYWPTGFSAANNSGYGTLAFGYPSYTPPAASTTGSVAIRQGGGVTVEDGSVGGWTLCGGNVNKWTEWGNLVWDMPGVRSEQVVIQNQRDVSDWPCFSRYYVNFPLNTLPRGKVIRSAKLNMYHFGGSNPAEAVWSYIQVLRVSDDWKESSLSWNSAPQAVENYPGIMVEPLPATPKWPGVLRTWDVTQALVDIYNSNPAELRLALYSADSGMHSGKYFYASESTAPPTLTIEWGEP